uniref:Immune-type receptor 4 n=1 Tax=Sphoeroides nephelus TaxID=39110 RepID=Q9IB06_9TELE|nr:immune-type receptor 4 [Sphoeroides nephelus]
MTSATLFFFLICLEKLAQAATMGFSPSMNGNISFMSVKRGQNLTLLCMDRDEVSNKIFVFKQTLGEKPKLICSYYIQSNIWSFFNEFKNNSRFQLRTTINEAMFTITDLDFSDSATYYCTVQYLYLFDFTMAYNVVVEGSGLTSHQSPSESIQSGGSVTLNCTVQAGNCDGDHTVYWFRNSGQSQLGLMYNHGDRKEQCERKTNTCFYSLILKNQSISHSGSYYCAVAACGRILFGNGTNLNLRDEKKQPALMYFLSAALTFTIIIVIFLSISLSMSKKRNSHHSLDTQSRFTNSSMANTQDDQEEVNVHYAALNVNRQGRSRTQRKCQSQNECVYAGVRQ